MPGLNDEKKRTARRQIKRVSAKTVSEPEIQTNVLEQSEVAEEKAEEVVEKIAEEIVEEIVEDAVQEQMADAFAEPVISETAEPEVVETIEPVIIETTAEKADEPVILAEEAKNDYAEIDVPEKMENPEAKSISIIRIGAVLLLVCAIVTLALSLVNFLTEGKISDNKINAMNAAVKEIFPDSTASKEIDYVYSEPVAGVYEVMREDKHIGYAVSVIPSGFAGDIEMLVGIDHNGEVAGVRVLSLSETPNVGSKVADSNYLAGYDGKTGSLVLGSDIDAISGATVSSRAVIAGVNAVLSLELKVEGVVDEDDGDSDVTIDLNKEFPVDSSLETEVIPSDSVPPVSYETVYREETAVPETEATETSIIEIKTEPVETTAEPDETSVDTTAAESTGETTVETTQAEETIAPDETSAAA